MGLNSRANRKSNAKIHTYMLQMVKSRVVSFHLPPSPSHKPTRKQKISLHGASRSSNSPRPSAVAGHQRRGASVALRSARVCVQPLSACQRARPPPVVARPARISHLVQRHSTATRRRRRRRKIYGTSRIGCAHRVASRRLR